MKHSGSCHCGSWKFETNHDPMFLYQCNCESCRKLNGSYSLGACYQEDEFVCSGSEVDYNYRGGSGELMKTRFCPTCHVRLTVRPEVLPELVFIPLGNFYNPNQFQKIDLEIWTPNLMLSTTRLVLDSVWVTVERSKESLNFLRR